MKGPIYNRDLMHCQQDTCKKRNTCYRYWLGQHGKGVVTMYMPDAPVVSGCAYYVDIENYTYNYGSQGLDQ